ncbi:fused MFS/spermidine synthase [Actinocrinis puniceicyclus]|uniref:Fused MFS/spermidine synthase n=1 Tax=Actinocrinis puniceicyclus TaxID=977794 RepID=A0A8J7WSC7_9ACTN|nr:fused MFS/spermidine synthase [Actinocrinis puniceicyclus]MBS2966678.1 fused MFS/spermidine synthase [Actinocrinis puniceicyclus]
MPPSRRERRAAAQPATASTASGVARLLPDVDCPGALLLTLDGVPQSYVDPDDPARLEFEYVQRLAHVVDAVFPAAARIDAVHLGGGALTLPRYLAHSRPGSGQLVVEIDAQLIEFVRARLPWDRRWRLRVRAGDAREALASRREGSADLVVADAFAGARTPAHLTSVQFVALAAGVLRPGGAYAANLADGAPLAFARGQAATVRAVFPHVALIAEPAVLRGRRFGNLVLAGAREPLPVAELARRAAADPFPARVTAGRELEEWIAGAAPVTDADAVPSPAPPPGAFEL